MHFVMKSSDCKIALQTIFRRVKDLRPSRYVWLEADSGDSVTLKTNTGAFSFKGQVIEAGQALADRDQIKAFQQALKEDEDIEVKLEGQSISFRQGTYMFKFNQAVVDPDKSLRRKRRQ